MQMSVKLNLKGTILFYKIIFTFTHNLIGWYQKTYVLLLFREHLSCMEEKECLIHKKNTCPTNTSVLFHSVDNVINEKPVFGLDFGFSKNLFLLAIL